MTMNKAIAIVREHLRFCGVGMTEFSLALEIVARGAEDFNAFNEDATVMKKDKRIKVLEGWKKVAKEQLKIKQKDLVGMEEIRDFICDWEDKNEPDNSILSKSLLTNYSIRRRG